MGHTDTDILPDTKPDVKPRTKVQPAEPKRGRQTGVGAAGKTIADVVQEQLLGLVFIYSNKKAAEIRKNLGWEKPSRTYKYRDVNWPDFAEEFEVCAESQKIAFYDHNIFTSYALYVFESEYNPAVNRILTALHKHYPSDD